MALAEWTVFIKKSKSIIPCTEKMEIFHNKVFKIQI
jgi:hypothetical protein